MLRKFSDFTPRNYHKSNAKMIFYNGITHLQAQSRHIQTTFLSYIRVILVILPVLVVPKTFTTLQYSVSPSYIQSLATQRGGWYSKTRSTSIPRARSSSCRCATFCSFTIMAVDPA